MKGVVHTGVCLIRGVWSMQECVSYEGCGPYRSVSRMKGVVHAGVCLIQECGPCRSVSRMKGVVNTSVVSLKGVVHPMILSELQCTMHIRSHMHTIPIFPQITLTLF